MRESISRNCLEYFKKIIFWHSKCNALICDEIHALQIQVLHLHMTATFIEPCLGRPKQIWAVQDAQIPILPSNWLRSFPLFERCRHQRRSCIWVGHKSTPIDDYYCRLICGTWTFSSSESCSRTAKTQYFDMVEGAKLIYEVWRIQKFWSGGQKFRRGS